MSATLARAADKPNFSGMYVAVDIKPDGTTKDALQVFHTKESIQIINEFNGKPMLRCPFDGSEGEYIQTVKIESPATVWKGKCKGRLTSTQLIIEAEVVLQTIDLNIITRVPIKDTWQLSADGKTLTIRHEVAQRRLPPEMSSWIKPPRIQTYDKVVSF
jgi:hypothetical protein